MIAPGSTGADRPLRRDAARNRERLLAAARDVFDAQGLDASVEDIARGAGVGMGTLYRRFPTKDALIEALVHEVLDVIVGIARDAADHHDGTGLERFLVGACAYQAENRGCLPRLWNSAEYEGVQIARQLISRLLDDAKQHGRVREDLTATDLTMVMWSVRGIIETTHMVAPEAWRRHLDLVLAGMRPAATALDHPPLSSEDLDAVLTSGFA